MRENIRVCPKMSKNNQTFVVYVVELCALWYNDTMIQNGSNNCQTR